MAELPDKDVFVDCIALSSPSGRISKRALRAAKKRIRIALFGPEGLPHRLPPQPSESLQMIRQAKRLRDLASRGLHPRKYKKEAARLEMEAAKLK